MTPLATYTFGGVPHHVVVAAVPARRCRRGRAGWEKVAGGICGGIWQHASGLQVHHCGHQTANWPYYGVRPDGTVLFMSNGLGFRRLAEAQAAVESELSPNGGAA